MNASRYGLLCGLLLIGQPLYARGDVAVSWSSAKCPAGTWPVEVTARSLADTTDVKTFTGKVTVPGTFSLPLAGLYQRPYIVSAITDGRFSSKSQVVRGDVPAPSPTPPPLPWAITKPKTGETVRGDFTATLQAPSVPFRVELLKPDGTLALPPFIRRTADPFVLTGASALPSGTYTLVVKASVNQPPPYAASVTITLDNSVK